MCKNPDRLLAALETTRPAKDDEIAFGINLDKVRTLGQLLMIGASLNQGVREDRIVEQRRIELHLRERASEPEVSAAA